MKATPHSDSVSFRIRCLLAIGAILLPLTLTGQEPSIGEVLSQAGVNGAVITALPTDTRDSPAGGFLLGIFRRIRKPHDKPVPHATAVVTVKTGGDTLFLQLYLPTAHHAVIAGDVTDWQPVEMTRQQGGWWVVALPVIRTVSRLDMRGDDGVWSAIPGLPATPDEYGGTVSLLVVPEDATPHK